MHNSQPDAPGVVEHAPVPRWGCGRRRRRTTADPRPGGVNRAPTADHPTMTKYGDARVGPEWRPGSAAGRGAGSAATTLGPLPATRRRSHGDVTAGPRPGRRTQTRRQPHQIRTRSSGSSQSPSPSAVLEHLVELVEVAHDVGAELRRAVRVDGEVLLLLLRAALGAPAVGPVHEQPLPLLGRRPRRRCAIR